jgi:hypothetical protein
MLYSWVLIVNLTSHILAPHFYGSSLQNTSVSPDGKLLAVLGDNVECLIADAQSGKVNHSFWLLLVYLLCSL